MPPGTTLPGPPTCSVMLTMPLRPAEPPVLLTLDAPAPPLAPTAITCSVPAWLGTVYWPSTPGVWKVPGGAAATGTDPRPHSTVERATTAGAVASLLRRRFAG